MIQTVEGRGVGAGKSYYVTTQVLKYLAEGGIVFASDTFVLKWEEAAAFCLNRYGVVIERDQWNTFPQKEVWKLHEITPAGTDEKPVLIIIDEAQTALNARDWADKEKRPFFEWLTQSRHDNNDLIFISQSAANIDKQIARLVTYIIRVRNMANFEFPGIGKWPLKQFVIARYDQDGRTLMKKQWVSHDRAVFGCYKSKSCGGSHRRLSAVLPPRKLQKVKRKSPMIKFLFVAVALVLGLVSWRVFGGRAEAATISTVASLPGGKAAPPKTIAFVREEWVGLQMPGVNMYDGVATLRTKGGVYAVGHACGFGLVEAIDYPVPGLSYAVARVDNAGVKTFVVASFAGDTAPVSGVAAAADGK
jgi:hypothetical protein